MEYRLNKRAQILSSELILAVFIFSIVLAYSFFLWNTVSKDIGNYEILYEMNSLSVDVAEKLIRTPGYPRDWVNLPMDDVSAIGLVSDSRVLDQEKVLRFLDVLDTNSFTNLCNNSNISNYECNKHFMGLGRYHLYFNMTYLNGTTVRLNGTDCVTGLPHLDAYYLVSVKRSAILNDEIMKVSFMIWV